MRPSYFDHNGFAAQAPGLKTLADAEAIRSKSVRSYALAELTDDARERGATDDVCPGLALMRNQGARKHEYQDDRLPFSLEVELQARGGIYCRRPDGERLVVRDGRLITGQNPASAAATAEALVEALGE